jgi:hypothetical protein
LCSACGSPLITPFHTIPATKLVLRDSQNTERRRIVFIARGTDSAGGGQHRRSGSGATLIIARGGDEVVDQFAGQPLTNTSNGWGTGTAIK